MSAKNGICGHVKSFQDAELQPCSSIPSVLDNLTPGRRRPPAVDSSPVQMHCRLILDAPLQEAAPDTNNQQNISSMLLLQVDTYVIKGSIMRKQTTISQQQTTLHGNPDVRRITAKIDCLLLRPLASLGNGSFGRVGCIYHMGRPRPLNSIGGKVSNSQKLINSCKSSSDSEKEKELNEQSCNNINWESRSEWEIDDLIIADSIYAAGFNKEGDGETITYTYRLDQCCPLGYNPMKQIVCPRFIGWISTYEPSSLLLDKKEKIEHISPYSFFIDVARGLRPMVAFAACPRSDEFTSSNDDISNSNIDKDKRKDAQRDIEDTGVFCVNLVSQELAWAMNASAAPLGHSLSEFNLMEGGSSSDQRTIPTTTQAPSVNAPYVSQSPMFMECRYVKTVKVPEIKDNDSMYSLIVGEVINIHIRKDCVKKKDEKVGEQTSSLIIDMKKARPVARLGYGQEYTVIEEEV